MNLTNCHICRRLAETDIEKCKLCCDGFEHEFCQECAALYRTFRSKFGKPEAEAAFAGLKDRRRRAA